MKIRDKRSIGEVAAPKSGAAGPSSTRATGTAAYGANAALTAPAAGRVVSDSTSIQGVSEAEMTPSVRDALMKIMGEVSQLRRELASVRERLRDAEGLADTDALVPVYNRRAFVREVTRAMSAAKRYGSSLGLVYLDLDGLKQLNDVHGHAAGDAALRGVATLLVAEVRESDVVARLGGDEFVILLTDISDSQFLIGRITEVLTVARKPIIIENEEIILSVSVGVCIYPNQIDDPDKLIDL